MTEKLVPIPVQVLAKELKDEIPESFLHKNGYTQPDAESLPWMDEVTIDFSLVFDPSLSPEAELERAKLHSALTQWGCFQAVNHGIPSTLLDEVREVTKQFFGLPIEEKQKYARELGDNNGYGNETSKSKDQPIDWADRLYLTTNPEESRKLKFWPENPPTFKRAIHEFNAKLRDIFDEFLKAAARNLKLEENSFLKEHGDLVTMTARFAYYPPCPTPENVLGIKPHGDGSTITFLLPDKEVEGLQVQKDDQWFRVPVIPAALFINVGDYFEIMSNGIFKSPIHRVVIDPERERKSTAVFCFPDAGREIGPLAELITEETPQVYKRVDDYETIFYNHFHFGGKPIDAVKI